jgi:hypothetical protein
MKILFLSFALFIAASGILHSQTLPEGYEAKNVQVIGYTALNDRPAFKISIKEFKGKWYLFTGHMYHPGWSIVDVTDPARPNVVKFIPGPTNTATIQMELHDTIMITSLEKILPAFGGSEAPFTEGVYIWSIANPVNPVLLGHYKTGGTGTHRNFFSGGKYMHLAAGMPGYKGNIYVIADISDPAHPKEVSRWWVPGQKLTEKEHHFVSDQREDSAITSKHPSHVFCGSDEEVSLHGPPYVVDSLVFLSYGAAGMIILSISDIRHPRQIGRLDFSPPFHARFGVHGVLPLVEKGIAYVNSEDVSYGKGPLPHASIVNITDLKNPTLRTLLPRPVSQDGIDFRKKPGWSGPHNINHLQHNPDVQKQDTLLYLTYFNAGLRVFNVANPDHPYEAGYFLSPHPTKRYGPLPQGELVRQTEDVLVDRRGYIYITHKNQGIWILKYNDK